MKTTNYLLKSTIIFFLFSVFYIYPAHAQNSFEKGMKEFREENYEEALSYFIEARNEDPKSSIAAYFLGLNYKVMEDYKNAVPHLRDAVTLIPHVKEALIELIDALYQTEGLDEAIKWIDVGEKEGIQPARLQFCKDRCL